MRGGGAGKARKIWTIGEREILHAWGLADRMICMVRTEGEYIGLDGHKAGRGLGVKGKG